MTKITFFLEVTISLLLIVITTNKSFAQPLTVLDVYYQSYAYPESFANFVYQNSEQFDDNFLNCLNIISRNHFEAGSRRSEECMQIAGYGQAFLDCINSNTSASIYIWTATVYEVIMGRVRWEDTYLGSSIIIAKPLLEQWYPGLWVQAVNASASMLAPYLTCY